MNVLRRPWAQAVLGALIGIAAFLLIRLAVTPPAMLRPVWARR